MEDAVEVVCPEKVKAPLALQEVGRNPTDRGKKRKQAKHLSR